jgi:hypothetical protein
MNARWSAWSLMANPCPHAADVAADTTKSHLCAGLSLDKSIQSIAPLCWGLGGRVSDQHVAISDACHCSGELVGSSSWMFHTPYCHTADKGLSEGTNRHPTTHPPTHCPTWRRRSCTTWSVHY